MADKGSHWLAEHLAAKELAENKPKLKGKWKLDVALLLLDM